MKIRCVTVDDEPPALSLISSYVKKTPFLLLEGEFNNPIEALDFIKKEDVQMVFLDIRMPNLTGMDLARQLPESTRIVFTTAYEEYALEGYKVSALDYLVKPFNYEEFLASAEKAKEYFDLLLGANKGKNFFFVKADYKLHKVIFNEIRFVENVKDYVKIHLKDGTFLMSLMNLKDVEETLPDFFMKVHRSYLVNINEISKVEKGKIKFSDHEIPVSDSFKDQFNEFLKSK
ncbi:MAG: DNA-binding LytR/AlgR family response regulator [Sphingobacteriales bacterium]|jgi:DNA-binding LytR/AlgR family response regulator